MAAGPLDDHYTILGIDVEADDAKLRRVWRRLALRWHPDRAGPAGTAMFQRISAAYEVLSDPVARAAYDHQRHTPVSGSGARNGGAARKQSEGPRRRAPAVMLSRLTGNLRALLTCGVARRVEPGLIELFLNAEEAAQGGMISVSMRVPVRCPTCAGSAPPCERCGSRGTVDELFSAWLAVPPGVTDGAILSPSELLRGTIRPVRFRMRVRSAR